MEGLKASMKTNTFLITFYVQNCCLSVQYFSNTKERILKNASLEGKNGLVAPRGHSGDHKSTSKVTCILRAHRNWLFMLFNVNLF